MKTEIEQKVIKTIAEVAYVNQDDINVTTNLFKDLQFDSLDILELVFQLEEQFKCDGLNELFGKEKEPKTVQDIILLMKTYLNLQDN